MSNKVKFQFDDNLDYQMQAINSVVNLFKGQTEQLERVSSIYQAPKNRRMSNEPVRNNAILGDSRLINNLRNVQFSNGLFASNSLEDKNFTIEMETGTGKTYVYLRTILELYKEYGFKKFMIVVPSIAIQKGIQKSIEQLQEHFKSLYDNIDILKHSSVYDSQNKSMSNIHKFIESSEINILILNIHSFNKESNKLRKPDERGDILWEEIKYIKPIVIIDEPQRIEGQKGAKSKTLQVLDDLEPLFTLRYSATHKKLYNQIYKLDSYDAYKQDLVKKIQVKTVNGAIEKDFAYIRYISFTNDLKARIEIFSQKQGDSIRIKSFDVLGNISLEELSGGLAQYKDMRIAENPHKLEKLKINAPNGVIELSEGESNYKLEDADIVRVAIKIAIKNHFEKQIAIIADNKKIKALTLFFVDTVASVRDFSQADTRGEFLRIFDEEYTDYIKKNQLKLDGYKEQLPDYSDVLKVREGYFAVDKNKKVVEIDDYDPRKDEVELKAKSQEDVDRGISLILEKKDELISFDEPLSFIFSHSALREGWDNPNVFTLCTLKTGSSEIAKKQEIGRGLRLPVDISGNRCLDAEINELTVIANDSYENFARTLQKDFNEKMNYNKNEVTAEILKTTLIKAGVPQEEVTPELVDLLRKELLVNKIIDSSNVISKNAGQTAEILETIIFSNEDLSKHAEAIKASFVDLMIEKGTNRIEVKNGDIEPYINEMQSFVTQEDFQEIYKNLCNNLTKRTLYKCEINKDKFIDEAAHEINLFLLYFKINKTVDITEGKAVFNDAQVFEIEKTNDIKDFTIEAGIKTEAKTDFEIVNYIMYHTMLPRLAIFKILKRIDKRNALNFQHILEKATQILATKLKNTKADTITSYEVIEGYELDEAQVFALDTISEEDFNEEWRVFKAKMLRSSSMNKYYKMDSKGEAHFAQKLEANENILLFTKLKKGGFVIDTPYGNYSPDWAVVCRKEGLEKESVGIYFIVETKAGKTSEDLTPVEKNKIKCGELHFKAVSDLMQFRWVSSYEDFKSKVGLRETL